jgi:hypothetical protein
MLSAFYTGLDLVYDTINKALAMAGVGYRVDTVGEVLVVFFAIGLAWWVIGGLIFGD